MKCKLVNYLDKVLTWEEPEDLCTNTLKGCLGQMVSLQVAYFGNSREELDKSFRIEINGELKYRIRSVGLVPCQYVCHPEADELYLTKQPSLLPDVLLPLGENESIRIIPGQWRAIWVDFMMPIEHKDAGTYVMTLKLYSCENELIQTFDIKVVAMPIKLPKQRLIHTQWLHTDCLADYYSVAVFSDEYWRITERYIKSMAAHGINTVLTPIFTPPLDTPVGSERPTVQLIDVVVTEKGYHFSFSKLDKWIRICEKAEIEYLEISHLFTQWGASNPPKIMAYQNGELIQIFGWDTPAIGAYTAFLRAVLPALKAHLKEIGWMERSIFHLSDEPDETNIENYAKARESIADLIDDVTVHDALSHYAFYERGLVQKPIVALDHLETFMSLHANDLWTYYCTGQYKDVCNRFMAMPSGRSLALELILYLYKIDGFLQWGFNFWYDKDAKHLVNPYTCPDAEAYHPAGDSFLVYPGKDGEPVESIRGMITRQAMDDYKLMLLAEECSDREVVTETIYSVDDAYERISIYHYPIHSEYYRILREKLYRIILKRGECV